jgi:hypothetical protein
MKIQIQVDSKKYGVKKGDTAFVSKARCVGDMELFGIKSPKPGVGIVWFTSKEIKQI